MFATVVALTIEGIFDLMLVSLGILLAGTLFSIIGALFWRGAHRYAAVISVVSATVALLSSQAQKSMGFVREGLQPTEIGFAVSFTAFVGISRLLPAETDQR